MPAVARQGDSTTGHSCFPPTVPSSYSSDVFANGLPVVRQGDGIVVHCCPDGPCHGGTYVGSHTVFVNGSSIQTVGDPISCGDTQAAGSPNVIAG